MISKKNRLLLLLLLLSVSGSVFSQHDQQIYRTIKGDIAFTIPYHGTSVIAASNQLIAMLDYDTGKLIFHVKYETLHTGIDSIDKKLELLTREEFKFDGRIDIFVNTKKKTEQKYNMTGMITSITPEIAAEGNGMVLCMAPLGDESLPSCKLFATLKCKLWEMGLTGVFENTDNDIQIELRQSLLEKEKAN